MISEGQVVLFQFPQTDNQPGKLRPALAVRKLPGRHEDWLICMISSRVSQEIPGFDQIIAPNDPDFLASGLKVPSLIRIGRLAVVDAAMLLGNIGLVDDSRMVKIKENLAQWLLNNIEIEKS